MNNRPVPDQVRVAPCQAKGHDVGLPQLVRGGPFKKPRLYRILFWLSFGLCDQTLIGKGLVNG